MNISLEKELLNIKKFIEEKYPYGLGLEITDHEAFEQLKKMHIGSLDYFLDALKNANSIGNKNALREIEKLAAKEIDNFMKILPKDGFCD